MLKINFYLFYAIFVLASFLSGCSGRQGIPVGEIPKPQKVDASVRNQTLSYAKEYAEQNGHTIVNNPKTKQRLQTMVDRLARASGATGFSYPVVLVDAGQEVNAAAVNGSVIMVYTELINRVKNDDELATIIGHEVAHIIAKHHADDGSKGRAEAVSLGSSVIGLVTEVGVVIAGGGSGVASVASDVSSGVSEAVGTGAFVLSYDRDMEREADHVGMMLMAKAGYNPEAAIQVWARAKEILGGESGSSFFSTHPSSSDRMERLKEALPIAMKLYSRR